MGPSSPKHPRGCCLLCGRERGAEVLRVSFNPEQLSLPPSSFRARWRSVCSRVLTASRLPGGGPQDYKPHLPAVAEPAEGWAARQAPTAAPGAHASCRLSRRWREGRGSHQIPTAIASPRLCPAPGFPGYLVPWHRGEVHTLRPPALWLPWAHNVLQRMRIFLLMKSTLIIKPTY